LELQTYRVNIQSGRVDGFIIVRTRRVDERVNFLRERNYPFVAFGRTEGNDDFPYVDEDSRQGMYLISTHLLELGHTRIGCISGPPELNFSNQRLEGIKSALVEYGLEYDPTLCRQSDMTQSGGYINAEELLSLDPHPTAIIACNDLMAFGAMSAAYKSGFIVGQDISITGFDDIPMSEHSHPPLTTVNQPIYEIGEMVCEMLIRLILGQELEHSQIILKPKLVVRQSTGENQR
jgi:LacI family transcriptional regulator